MSWNWKLVEKRLTSSFWVVNALAASPPPPSVSRSRLPWIWAEPLSERFVGDGGKPLLKSRAAASTSTPSMELPLIRLASEESFTPSLLVPMVLSWAPFRTLTPNAFGSAAAPAGSVPIVFA